MIPLPSHFYIPLGLAQAAVSKLFTTTTEGESPAAAAPPAAATEVRESICVEVVVSLHSKEREEIGGRRGEGVKKKHHQSLATLDEGRQTTDE